jgi:hypothetical protein
MRFSFRASLVTAFAVLFSFAACGGDDSTSTGPDATAPDGARDGNDAGGVRDATSPIDTGSDAAKTDAAVMASDGGADAHVDATTGDAGTDATPMDAEVDAATIDAGVDATTDDAGVDAMTIDAAVDATTIDAEVDATASDADVDATIDASDAAAPVDANMPTCGLPGACVATTAIPTTSGTQQGATYTLCPAGPNPNAMPPQCIVEIDLGNAALTVTSPSAGTWDVSGTIPVRLADLPITATILGVQGAGDGTINAGAVCPISTTEAFAVFTVQASGTSTGNGPVVLGCSAVSVTSLTLSASEVQSDVNACGFPPALVSLAESLLSQVLTPVLKSAITQAIQSDACLH